MTYLKTRTNVENAITIWCYHLKFEQHLVWTKGVHLGTKLKKVFQAGY